MSSSKVRWGILGCADIARGSFIPAVRETENGVLQAVGSRSKEKSEAFAREHGIARAYDSYTAVLEDPDVDAVYIPLPNTMHAEWIKQAAAAGKHVFCEKPLTMTYQQAKESVEACQKAGVLLVEAFVYRFHKQSAHIRKLLSENAIGDVLHTEARFHYSYGGPSDNIRLSTELGGGALLDVGCYTVSWSRFTMNEAPVAVAATSVTDEASGVDKTTVVTLSYSGGRTAVATSGIRMHGGQYAAIYGSQGIIEVTEPFHPRNHSAVRINVYGKIQDESVPTDKLPFTDAITTFHRAILEGEPLPFDVAQDILDQARTMEAVKVAAQEGRWIGLDEIV